MMEKHKEIVYAGVAPTSLRLVEKKTDYVFDFLRSALLKSVWSTGCRKI